MRPRMLDVAKQAGVSASTVCRALKEDPQIAEETRARVREIAVSMGYSLDPLLSALASRRRGRMENIEVTTIAYLTKFKGRLSWRNNPFYRRVFDGASARAKALGYQLQDFWLGEPGMSGERLSNILYNRGISAVCIAPTPRARSHLSFRWDRFSCITIGNSLLRPNLNRVSPHTFHGMLSIVRELRKLGYRRIGFCIFEDTSKRSDNLWLAAFLLCQRLHRDLKFSSFVFTDQNAANIPKWCAKERLEVIIGGEPIVLETLKKCGLFPGKTDYATLSWNGEEPAVAGLDQLPEQIGAGAINQVVAQLQRNERGLPAHRSTTLVEGIWKHGSSLKRVGKNGARVRTPQSIS